MCYVNVFIYLLSLLDIVNAPADSLYDLEIGVGPSPLCAK